jgi:hypothetical protein
MLGDDHLNQGRATLLRNSVIQRLDKLKERRSALLKQESVIWYGLVVGLLVSAFAVVSGNYLEPSLATHITTVRTEYANTFQFPWLFTALASTTVYSTYYAYKKLKTELLILGSLSLAMLSGSEFLVYQHDIKLSPSNCASVFLYSPPEHHQLPKSVVAGEINAIHYNSKTNNKAIISSIALAEEAASSLKTTDGSPALPNSWYYKMDMAAYGKAVHKQALAYVQETELWRTLFAKDKNIDQYMLMLIWVVNVCCVYITETQKFNIKRAEDTLISESEYSDTEYSYAKSAFVSDAKYYQKSITKNGIDYPVI